MTPLEEPQTAEGGEIFVEEHFAMVPEWLLDSNISDCSVRLYAILLRYGQSSGARMPSRSTLATRLRKKSTDTVDRAMRELVGIGAVRVEARYSGRERLTNLYRVRTSRPPGDSPAASPAGSRPPSGGGREFAATRRDQTTGGRKRSAGVTARMRHNPESSTQSETSPSPAGARPAVADVCRIQDWEAFTSDCLRARGAARQPLTRWRSQCLDAALQLAVKGRGWPALSAAQALLTVAADPASRSPMRVAEAGPWWDSAVTGDQTAALEGPAGDASAVAEADALLDEADGMRVALQAEARRQLADEGVPVTRRTVVVRAAQLLTAHRTSVEAGA